MANNPASTERKQLLQQLVEQGYGYQALLVILSKEK